MRPLRYLPHPGAVVEITQRTIHGRYLLKPSERLNALFIGCLARAQKASDVKVHAVAALSGHFHILASFDTVKQQARFMCHFKTNLSKEVGKLHDWPGSMFDGRYHSIPLSDEPVVQVKRLEYILSQGAKEGLVLSPRDWPGVHCANALADGEPLRGVWVDRTKLYAARQTKKGASEADFSHEEKIGLSPLPCWQEFEEIVRRCEVEGLLGDIEAKTLKMHADNGTVPLGVAGILSRHPHERPKKLAKRPMPRFHAATKAVRKMMHYAYREFYAAFRIAAEQLADGKPDAAFPENCFPPGLPFVEPQPQFVW